MYQLFLSIRTEYLLLLMNQKWRFLLLLQVHKMYLDGVMV